MHDTMQAGPINAGVRLDWLKPSPENDALYSRVNEEDPAFVELCDDIKQHGIREPIVATKDRFIVSGHRRHAAALKAGRTRGPVRYLPFKRSEVDDDEYLRLLRAYNRQRDKSTAERLGESLVDMDEGKVYANIQRRVYHDAFAFTSGIRTVCVRDRKARPKVTPARMPLVEAAKQVIEDNRDFLPISLRQIHYRLLELAPLRHAGKAESRYINDDASYKTLSKVLTAARIEGLIEFDDMSDETRPVTTWRTYDNPGQFFNEHLERLFSGYVRDKQRSQPKHIEILVEKNTVRHLVERVAGEYEIPVTSGRGFASTDCVYQMARRAQSSGKRMLVVIFASDLDPEGEELVESHLWRLREEYQVDVKGVKAAINATHVERFGLAPSGPVKSTSSLAPRFIERHGQWAYELEALTANDLMTVMRETINEVLDLERFNAEVDIEASEAATIRQMRERAKYALADIATELRDDNG